jgi:cyclopropane fatty-acyl-phospholipid synthase-like methyltransferase
MLGKQNCKICRGPTYYVGSRSGTFKKNTSFHYYSCQQCYFSFVGNPWLEYEKIYSFEYYNGKGADPLADYFFELKHPKSTIRKYEWEGLKKIIAQLTQNIKNPQHLDYGCGNGGLVRYLAHSGIRSYGFEEGAINLYLNDILLLEKHDLEKKEHSFDIISAIEVIEHIAEPLNFLKYIRSLLKPNGVFFLTTGNAQLKREKITHWSYAAYPEIHISFFEPKTLALALEQTGFKPTYLGFMRGYSDIIKFKVLKNIRCRYSLKIFDLLPWAILSRLIDKKLKITAHPLGVAAL